MSTLRRVVLSTVEPKDHGDRDYSLAVNPLPFVDTSGEVWRRVHGLLQRRIKVMEANIDKATADWGAEQGLSRAEWEMRMRNYAYALEELHKLAEDFVSSRNEIP
jgi:hypothetical protein